MRIDQVMSAPAVAVGPTATVKEAAALLAVHGFTVLPVVDGNGELVGVVSEGDLVADRFPRDAREPYRRTEPAPPGGLVREVMTRDVVTAELTDGVRDLVRRMRTERVRSVPVRHHGRVVGMVTYRDLVGVLSRADELIAAEVRRKLRSYGSRDRFDVTVRSGAVELTDRLDRRREWYTVCRLAEQVPGVVSAGVTGSCSPQAVDR